MVSSEVEVAVAHKDCRYALAHKLNVLLSTLCFNLHTARTELLNQLAQQGAPRKKRPGRPNAAGRRRHDGALSKYARNLHDERTNDGSFGTTCGDNNLKMADGFVA